MMPTACVDALPECSAWAGARQCHTNAPYMLLMCQRACGLCEAPPALPSETSAACSATAPSPADVSSSSQRTGEASTRPPHGAIVYLAQNRRHPLYGGHGRSNLERSLRLLHEHYNDREQHDVLIFHEGDFDEASQHAIAAQASAHPTVGFHTLPSTLWGPPAHVDAAHAATWHNPKFGLGYRNMCRLFSFLLHGHLRERKYEYAMRMDDDSFILSPIPYNIFSRMRERRWRYAYRAAQFEAPKNALGWAEAVASYVNTTSATAESARAFTRHCRPSGRAAACVSGPRNRTHPHLSEGWDGFTIYTNFYATELGWWDRPEVARFLEHIDRIGGTHYYRWGDALVHTAATQLFLRGDELAKLGEWTYQHASVRHADGALLWGGVFAGSDDPAAAATLEDFQSRHGGATLVPAYWQPAIENMEAADARQEQHEG